MYGCMCTYTYIHIYICIWYIDICTCIHMCMYVHMHMYKYIIPVAWAPVRKMIQSILRSHFLLLWLRRLFLWLLQTLHASPFRLYVRCAINKYDTRIYMCIYKCIYICIDIYICIYVYIYIYACTHMHICMLHISIL